MQIPLLLPNAKGEYDVPVSIAPQEVYRFTAVSEARVDNLDANGVMVNVFTAGDRNCYLGILVTLPGRNSLQPVHTVQRLFRDWKTGFDIPPKNTTALTKLGGRR
jgi:hypothetical protein